jgi:hypothetical protein
MPRAEASARPERLKRADVWLGESGHEMWRSEPVRKAPRPTAPANGVPGRRTVTITGRGAERYDPHAYTSARRRPQRPRHQRAGFRPDRAAMWAVLLGLVLLFVAATSSHAAVLSVRSCSLQTRHGTPPPVAVRRNPYRAPRPG